MNLTAPYRHATLTCAPHHGFSHREIRKNTRDSEAALIEPAPPATRSLRTRGSQNDHFLRGLAGLAANSGGGAGLRP